MNNANCELAGKHCKPCEGGVDPMTAAQIQAQLKDLSGWEHQNGGITRTFHFTNYHETMAFVNATAWISHSENHHPDLEVGYNMCRVFYVTHAIRGLSENDFICAAKIQAL